MKKRLVSMILALALCMGLAVPGLATEDTENSQVEQSEAYVKDGVLYLKVENVEYYRIGNEIFSGGEKLATVTYNTTSDVMPAGAHWRYIDQCPHGTRYEYTKHMAAADRIIDIEFEKKLGDYTESVLSGIITLALAKWIPEHKGELAGIFAGATVAFIEINPKFSETKALYVKERVMGHETLSSFYRMNVFFLYLDKELTQPVGGSDSLKILYQYWA